jgi:hypothetical protein
MSRYASMYVYIYILLLSLLVVLVLLVLLLVVLLVLLLVVLLLSLLLVVCVYIYIYVCQKRVAANDSKCVGQMYLYCQTSVHTSRSFSGGLITVECSPKFVYPSPLSQKIRANKKPSICHRPHQPNQPSLRLCARLNSSCHPKCARL